MNITQVNPTMLALVLRPDRDLYVEEVPTPEVGDDEVLIAVEGCGLCYSDVKGRKKNPQRRQTTEAKPLWMGHEPSGKIAALGKNVTGWQIGDSVVIDSTVYCNKCPKCLAGKTNLCKTREVLGVAPGNYSRNGAYAQYVAVPHWILHRKPQELSFVHASLYEPGGVAAYGIERANLAGGEKVAILGTGLIASITIQMLKLRGHDVVAFNRGKTRLEATCARYGIEGRYFEELGSQKAIESLQEFNVDAVVDVVGTTDSVRLAMHGVADGGTVVFVGDTEVYLSAFPLHQEIKRDVRTAGSCAFPARIIPEVLGMMTSGELDVAPLLSAEIGLHDAAEMFLRIEKGAPEIIKVVINPNLGLN